MTPEISVIVPAYNGENVLRETLDSILAQTWKQFEVVIVDDGSRDSSVAVIESFKDKRIRLIRQEHRGLCHSLNRAIQEASAPLIARNDQDDLSCPNRLERQLAVMNQSRDAIALFSNYTKFGSRRRWSNADKMKMSAGTVANYDPIKHGCILGSTMFARASALRSVGGFRQEYYPCDDWDLELRLVETGRVLLLQEPLVAYRFHAAANTYRLFAEMQNKSRWTEDSHRRRTRREAELSFEGFLAAQPTGFWTRVNQRRRDAASFQMRTAGQCYLDGRYLSAMRRLMSALLLNPQNIFERVGRMLQCRLTAAPSRCDSPASSPPL